MTDLWSAHASSFESYIHLIDPFGSFASMSMSSLKWHRYKMTYHMAGKLVSLTICFDLTILAYRMHGKFLACLVCLLLMHQDWLILFLVGFCRWVDIMIFVVVHGLVGSGECAITIDNKSMYIVKTQFVLYLFISCYIIISCVQSSFFMQQPLTCHSFLQIATRRAADLFQFALTYHYSLSITFTVFPRYN